MGMGTVRVKIPTLNPQTFKGFTLFFLIKFLFNVSNINFIFRLRTGSLDSETVKVNGIDHLEIERFKQEIMTEIRKEFNKMKVDIIEGKH
jgi:hypothetical protein